MARRDDLLELLRPPAHRGPLIAAGAVLFTAGIALEEQRLDEVLPNGVHVLIVAGRGRADPRPRRCRRGSEGGRPAAYQSVLLVCGLLLLEGALLELADLLGADFERRLPGRRVRLDLAAALRRGALPGDPAQLRDLRDGRRDRARRRGPRRRATGSSAPTRRPSTAGCCWRSRSRSCSPRSCCAAATRATRELMVITAGLATLAIALVASVGALVGAFAGFGASEPTRASCPASGSSSCSAPAAG